MKLVFPRKPDAAPKKGIRSYRSIALTSVMSKWFATCVILRLEKDKEPEGGSNCTWVVLMVSAVNAAAAETLGVAGRQEEEPVAWQGKETHDALG